MQLIVATRNAHKTREIQRILGPAFTVSDLSAHPAIPDIHETGKSYEENAILKAVGASKHLSALAVADDSGLEVDTLGGAPGIFSARYAGENATDKQNIDKLLGELARTGTGETKRSACFRCVIALARQGELLGTFEGIVEGTIVERVRGSYGFGYDPIFVPHGFEETFAELPAEVKNTISHRAKALRGLTTKLAALKTGD
ncbi:MAG: RdgB/HAM1 family non-canonical purine NTP pyrophosphatase [Candidatus Udaeobacter sp.]